MHRARLGTRLGGGGRGGAVVGFVLNGWDEADLAVRRPIELLPSDFATQADMGLL